MDLKTEEKLLKIKNEIFKINILDIEAKLIVNSVYLKKNNKNEENINNKQMKTMVWEYYKSRNKTNVNDIINKYGRTNLIINYSL